MKSKPLSIRDSYKLYKEENSFPVDIKIYIDLCNKFNKFLMDKVINGEEITLPARMGTIYIFGKKQYIRFDENGNVQGLAPDWVKTKKLWDSNKEAKDRKQLLYHTNESTNNVRYKFFWSKKNVFLGHKSLYSIRFTRDNKRSVYKKIKEGKEYIIK